jgi:hypothetical protein
MMEFQYRNQEKCRKCGGKCCKIYLAAEEGGARNTEIWFEDWCLGFHSNPDSYGVTPLFDPLIIYMTGNEYMLEDLKDRGIDPNACQYLGKDGCMIQWDKRPLQCRTWKCELFDESDIVKYCEGGIPCK